MYILDPYLQAESEREQENTEMHLRNMSKRVRESEQDLCEYTSVVSWAPGHIW